MSGADRQRRFRERMREAGLVQYPVWVPIDRLADLNAYAKQLREAIAAKVDADGGMIDDD
jgi:hypothetical protein